MSKLGKVLLLLVLVVFSREGACREKLGTKQVFSKHLGEGRVVEVIRQDFAGELPLPKFSDGLIGTVREPNSVGVYSLTVKSSGKAEAFQWSKTVAEYGGPPIKVLDISPYQGSLVVLYMVVGDILQAEVIKPNEASSPNAIVKQNFILQSDFVFTGVGIKTAALNTDLIRGLSCLVEMTSGTWRHFYYANGVWKVVRPTPVPQAKTPVDGLPVPPDEAYREHTLFYEQFHTGESTENLTVTRLQKRPSQSSESRDGTPAQPASEATTNQSRTYVYKVILDKTRVGSTKPFIDFQRKELWSQRLENVTSDDQLLGVVTADYKPETEVLIFVYQQGETLFANVIRPDSKGGRNSLPLSQARLPDVDVWAVQTARVTRLVNGEPLFRLILSLSTGRTIRYRLVKDVWIKEE